LPPGVEHVELELLSLPVGVLRSPLRPVDSTSKRALHQELPLKSKAT
jgi:hypothetical protein